MQGTNMFKRSFLVILAGLLILPATLVAQQNTTRFFIPYDFGNLTVDTTSGGVPFPAAKVTNPNDPVESANLVTFSVSCASGTSCNIRFTLDGTAPTTSVGILLQYGAVISIYQHNAIENFRAIREGATSAVLNVQYFR